MGLPATRRRDLLPGSVASLDRRLRRPRRQHRDELLPARQRRQRRLERRGGERTARPAAGRGGAAPGGAVAADLRRPRPGRRAAPVHGRHRPPAPRRGALVLRPLVSALRGRAGPGRRAAERRCPDLGEPDLHALPALRRSRRPARRAASPNELVPLARAGDDDVLQPDDLHRLRRGLRGSGPARRADRDGGGRSLRLPLQHRQPVPGLAVRLLERRRPGDVRRAARRGRRRRLRRLDGGLRRVHAARLALGERHGRNRDAQPLPRSVPLRRPGLRPQRRPAARPLHPLRLHRGGAVRADRLGRRPDRRVGLRRACVGGDERPDDGPVGNQHLGLRHRRLLRARRQPAHPRAAPALGPVRRRLRRHADPGERDRAARQGPPADLGRRPDRQLAPLREAAHQPLSVHRRRRGHLPAQRAADHASPRPRLPRRPAGSGPRRRVPVRARPARGARSSSRERASAALYLPAGRWVDLWRSAAYREERRAAAARAEDAPRRARGHDPGALGRAAAAGSRRDGPAAAAARRRHPRRLRRGQRGHRRAARASRPHRPAGVPARPQRCRASTTTGGSPRSSGAGAGRCGCGGTAAAPTSFRPRSGR